MSRICWSLVLIFCSISRIKAQIFVPTPHDHNSIQEDELGYKYPNVLSLKFHLQHRRVPDLLTKITLSELPCPIEECNISLFDIVDAIQLEKYSNEDIADAIDQLKISGPDSYNIMFNNSLNASSVDSLLKKAGTTFSESYKYFVDSIDDPANTIPKLLGILNVSVSDFMNAQAYGNDTTRLEVLSTGNYSQVNVKRVFLAIKKNFIGALKAFPLNTMVKNLRNFDSDEFTKNVKNLKVTSAKLLDFYKYLNITSINFITYPGYIKILTDFESYLNPEEAVATVITNTTLVTSNKSKSLIKFQTDNTEFVRNYSYFQAENIVNPIIHYHIKDALLGNTEYLSKDIAIIEVYNAYKGNITQLNTTYNNATLLDCTYVTKLPYGEIYTENFTSVHNLNGTSLSIAKTNTTVYNLGSPLFCSNRLVGMAIMENATNIQFSTFLKKTSENQEPPSQQSTPSPTNTTTPSFTIIPKPSGTIYVISLIIALVVLFN